MLRKFLTVFISALTIAGASKSSPAQEYSRYGYYSPAGQRAESSSVPGVKSVMLEGGPIASKHFQPGDENFHERHTLVIAKVETMRYGTWGAFLLTPNSVENTSVAVGYITKPYVLPLGPASVELTGSLGAVTGYQDYPVPMLAGQARLVLYRGGKWDAGLSAAAMPYIMEDNTTGDYETGVVVTTPVLSMRYNFQ